MKTIILSVIICFFCFTGFATVKNLNAYFNYSKFYSPQHGPYIETYLTIVGHSVEYNKNENGNYQASLEITFQFMQDSEVKNYKSYNLFSPEVSDTTVPFPDFVDQQRITIPEGIYNFDITIKDRNSDGKKFDYKDIITIDYDPEDICFSDIQLLESFKLSNEQSIYTKSGYDLVPYVSDYYPRSVNKLKFYTEIYNTNKVIEDDVEYLVRYYIESFQGNNPLHDYNRFQKQKASDVNVVLNEFPIEKLSSGNYNLVFEIRDRENTLLKKNKIFFQRSNPDLIKDINLHDLATVDIEETFVDRITDLEVMRDYLGCIRPIANDKEKYFIDNHYKTDKLKYMQQFFYTFWKNRNSSDPGAEWNYYYEKVEYVNKSFGTMIKKGHETDRGRVFLQYGAPNSVVDVKHEPSSYPYEIWHYHKIGGQTNLRFVFYNPELAGNDYALLHSDLRGELYNANWERYLNKRNNSLYDHDQNESDPHYGGRAKDYYDTP